MSRDQKSALVAILRDASLRDAPQDEGGIFGARPVQHPQTSS